MAPFCPECGLEMEPDEPFGWFCPRCMDWIEDEGEPGGMCGMGFDLIPRGRLPQNQRIPFAMWKSDGSGDLDLGPAGRSVQISKRDAESFRKAVLAGVQGFLDGDDGTVLLVDAEEEMFVFHGTYGGRCEVAFCNREWLADMLQDFLDAGKGGEGE